MVKCRRKESHILKTNLQNNVITKGVRGVHQMMIDVKVTGGDGKGFQSIQERAKFNLNQWLREGVKGGPLFFRGILTIFTILRGC